MEEMGSLRTISFNFGISSATPPRRQLVTAIGGGIQ
jgi:hypothetical protein